MSKEIKKRLHEAIKLKGVTYDVVTTNGGKVLVGEEGILGHDDTLIPWADIETYMTQYGDHKSLGWR